MTSVYVHPRMVHTVFQDPATRAVMEASGVTFVASPDEADVLVAHHVRLIEDFARDRRSASRKLLLWTHEPRLWTDRRKSAVAGGRRVRVLSVYSREIYTDNYYYARIPKAAFEPQEARGIRSRRIVCVARGLPLPPLKVAGKSIDLTRRRAEVALYGHALGVVDIYGRHWPEGVSKGESRDGAWVVAKYELLRPYSFNLCFENTRWPYYVTEKLWHAIYCGCLPIYYGQPCVYEDFPRDSFIDYARIRNPEALYEMVATMPPREFTRRYNACLEVFRRAYARGHAARRRAAEHVAGVIGRMCR